MEFAPLIAGMFATYFRCRSDGRWSDGNPAADLNRLQSCRPYHQFSSNFDMSADQFHESLPIPRRPGKSRCLSKRGRINKPLTRSSVLGGVSVVESRNCSLAVCGEDSVRSHRAMLVKARHIFFVRLRRESFKAGHCFCGCTDLKLHSANDKLEIAA